ncbi:TetR/AcrR family transcriptional regulator [Arthrobacter sp. MW3 TE3886]|jgi:AcrR family transcriptional regulator|uniref:TetR/AcrR family transcriptional regulator n=1 Tax=Arthrobacter sp. MW3 TE3886 TaxID=3156254 RepID=UPI0035194D86
MTEPALRKDAELNRQRLMAAGREVFARRGLDATLNDVAHHAGVGVGTAYRRFANKEELIDAILEQQVGEIERILRAALAEPDAWKGLVMYLEGLLAMQAKDRGIAQIQSGRRGRREKYDWQRDRLAPLVNELADRGRAQGVLRPDATGTDLIFLQIALTAISETVADRTEPGILPDVGQLYRRYLWIALDGLRARPEGVSPLPVGPLTTEETHTLLGPPQPGADTR